MAAASLIGWMIMGVLVAFGICAKKTSTNEVTSKKIEEVIAQTPITDKSAICETLEHILRCKALVFDFGLVLVEVGNRAKVLTGNLKDNAHMIDIVPANITPLFLDGAAAARRGEPRSWRCKWNDADVEVRSAPSGKNRIAIAIMELPI